MDRSLGTLRAALRDLGIADNTLLAFCSDNGGRPDIRPDLVGGLRGRKGSLYEGGLRVPGIIEWPAVIRPRITSYPACTMNLFPTVADILNLPATALCQPVDGVSLRLLFNATCGPRERPIPFRFGTKATWVDNWYKRVAQHVTRGPFRMVRSRSGSRGNP